MVSRAKGSANGRRGQLIAPQMKGRTVRRITTLCPASSDPSVCAGRNPMHPVRRTAAVGTRRAGRLPPRRDIDCAEGGCHFPTYTSSITSNTSESQNVAPACMTSTVPDRLRGRPRPDGASPCSSDGGPYAVSPEPIPPQSNTAVTFRDSCAELARSAVQGLLPVRFSGPLAEPAVRLST